MGPTMRRIVFGGVLLSILALGFYFAFIHSNEGFTRAGEKFKVPPSPPALDGEVPSIDSKMGEEGLNGEVVKRGRSELDRIPLLEIRVREGKGAGLLRGVRCYWIKKAERSIPNRLQKERKIGETDKGGIVRIYHLKKEVEKWEVLFQKKGFYSKSYSDFSGIKEGAITTRNVFLKKGKFGDCRVKVIDQLGKPISDVYVVLSKKTLPFCLKRYEIAEIGSSKAGVFCKKTGSDGIAIFKNIPVGGYCFSFDKKGYLFKTIDGIEVLENGSKLNFVKGISFGIASFVVNPKFEILHCWAMRLNHSPIEPTHSEFPWGSDHSYVAIRIVPKKNQKVFLVRQAGPKLGNQRGIIDWILVSVLFRTKGIVLNKRIPVYSFDRFKNPTMITPSPIPSQGWVRFTPKVFSPDGEPIKDIPLKFVPMHPSRHPVIPGYFKVVYGKPLVIPVGQYRIFASSEPSIEGAFHPTKFSPENLRERELRITLDKKFYPVKFKVFDPYQRALPYGTTILLSVGKSIKNKFHGINNFVTTRNPKAWLPPGEYLVGVFVGTYPHQVAKKFVVKNSSLTVPVHLVD